LNTAIQLHPQELAAFQQQKTTLTQEIATLQQQKDTLTQETTTLQQQKDTLTQEIPTLQQQKATLTQEIPVLQQQKAPLTQEITTLNQEKTILNQEKTTLNQEITTLKQQKGTINHEMVVEAMYGSTGLAKLRKIVQDLTQEEGQTLKELGFDRGEMDKQLEGQHKATCSQFVSSTCGDVANKIGQHLEKTQKSVEQGEAGLVTVEQAMRGAGILESIIANTLQQIRQHSTSLQGNAARWKQLKADVEGVTQNTNQ